MFYTNETIKFMMAKIFFTLADFRFQTMSKAYPSHYHGINTLEIHFVKKGSGTVIINNNEYHVKENWFYVVPSFVSHTQIPDKNNPMEKYSIYLLIDKSRGFENYIPLLDKSYIGEDKYNTVSFFDLLLSEFQNKKFGYNEIVVSCFKSIIVNILRDVKIEEKRESSWQIDSIQFQIEEVLLNEFKTITIESLANKFFMSVRELQRYLKDNYKKTFNELKKEARMSYASNKLIYTDLSIAEIAENCGYSSLEHFSYAFKNYYNVSPLKYRQERKKQL